MAISLIDIGTIPNDGTGDPLRSAFQKINSNFSYFAPVAFTGQYSSLYGVPSFASVAFSGNYNDLTGKPTLGSLAGLSSIGDSLWSGPPLSIPHGGTGQTDAHSAFNALSPMYQRGDTIYHDGSSSNKLSVGYSGQVLTVSGAGIPSWATPTIVTPGGSNTQIQYNLSGAFTGAGALTYSSTGNNLTISSTSSTSTPLNITGASSQSVDLLDIVASNGTVIDKITSNGSLFIQGAANAPNSLEFHDATVFGQYLQLKLASGTYGPYFKTNVDGSQMLGYCANGQPIGKLGWGGDTFIYRFSAGCLHHHNLMNPCIFRTFNWWQDDDNWESCGWDWQGEENVCRFGTHKLGSGNTRELHFVVGGTKCFKLDAFGNIIHGIGALSTSATDGFVYHPTCAGTPSGAPTNYTGMASHVINSATKTLNYNIGGSWYKVALTAGAG